LTNVADLVDGLGEVVPPLQLDSVISDLLDLHDLNEFIAVEVRILGIEAKNGFLRLFKRF
jgi:hypothetical protein